MTTSIDTELRRRMEGKQREPSWLWLKLQLQIENIEASVALSHEADCNCSVCNRVRERHKKRVQT